jgi:hypothetical protein
MMRLGGRSRPSLTWLVLAASAISAPARAEPPTSSLSVSVTIAPSTAAAPAVEGELAWLRSEAGQVVEVSSVAVNGPGQYQLDAGDRGSGVLQEKVPGYWAADQALVAGGGAGAAEPTRAIVELIPTGALKGSIAVPRGHELPEALELRFGPASFVQTLASATSAKAAGAVACAVVEEGRWHCEIPEGVHDLRWHAKGFASVLRWEVPVVAGGETAVEALSLIPGGAILGFVEAEGDQSSAAETSPAISVELTMAGGEAMRHDARRRLGYLRQSGPVGPDGSFQFTGLAPGVYRIKATAEGLAQTETAQVEVFEGRESRLIEPVRLEPLAVQTVHVVPPQTPEGKGWTVSLAQPGTGPQIAPCRTDSSGTCNLTQIPAGEYALRVEDRPGSVWREEWVNVAPGGLPLEIELPIVPIEGRITLGHEPTRARLLLRREDEGAAVELFSDHDGSFHGHLPAEGEWAVSALFRAQGAESSLGAYRIDRPGDGGPAWLELELPDTTLRGRVVGPDGKGVPRAAVVVLERPDDEQREPNRARSDEDGWFWYWGLGEGTYVARAIGRYSAATSDEFELREGELGEVEVRLAGARTLRGRVIGQLGPVAGAEVHVLPEVALSELPGVSRSVTGPGGLFEVEVPAVTSAVTVTVLAPGQAARIVRLPLPEREPVDVEVQRLGGTLEVRDPGGSLLPGYRLAHDGATTWLGTLLVWPALHGMPARLGEETLTLPMMEPGVYRFCSPNQARCAEGRLEPGGVLELVIQESGQLPEVP